MPAIAHQAAFKSAYRSYLGSLSDQLHVNLGMNSTTHVARVCLNPDDPAKAERAVVKCFHYSDHKWVNELAAWNLAQHTEVATTPRAALLIAQRADITPDHGPEINAFAKYVTTPIVMWCTSAIEPTSPVQQVLGHNWETACLRTDAGRRLGAMDGWIGNCDRIPANAPYWTSGTGGVVAIDFEKMAFSQDWSLSSAQHWDEMVDADGNPLVATKLISAIKVAHKSKDKATKTAAKKAIGEMFHHSSHAHSKALDSCRPLLERVTVGNFGSRASANLLSFLDYRVSEECIKRRYGILL